MVIVPATGRQGSGGGPWWPQGIGRAAQRATDASSVTTTRRTSHRRRARGPSPGDRAGRRVAEVGGDDDARERPQRATRHLRPVDRAGLRPVGVPPVGLCGRGREEPSVAGGEGDEPVRPRVGVRALGPPRALPGARCAAGPRHDRLGAIEPWAPRRPRASRPPRRRASPAPRRRGRARRGPPPGGRDASLTRPAAHRRRARPAPQVYSEGTPARGGCPRFRDPRVQEGGGAAGAWSER